MDLSKIREKAARFAVGLTCGNSCVGIDAVLVRIKGTGPKAHIKLVDAKHFAHSPGLRTRLLVARKDAHELGLLNIQLGHRMAEAAYEMVRAASTHLCEVDFIAMEGATVAHAPHRGPDSDVGSLTMCRIFVSETWPLRARGAPSLRMPTMSCLPARAERLSGFILAVLSP